MELSIRNYVPGDIRELTRIDETCFPGAIAFSRAELRFYASHPASIARVAEAEGRIAGFLIARVERERAAHLITLDVVPEMRRRGVATRLIEVLHAHLESRGIRRVVLEVDTRNTAALGLYRRFGYAAVALVPGYYNGTRDAVRMVRTAPSATVRTAT
jgi:ribosomal-protein-alanine N-acetyltransferase